MNIDRSLNIYQAYSLAKINTLNKQMLIAQYAQCQQIGKLEKTLAKELNAINATNQQILRNQLNEAKHKEAIRYYRNLAHQIKECVEIIDEQHDNNFKILLLKLFQRPLSLYLEDAKTNLEEIADKEFCSKWEKTLISNISLSQQNINSFASSPYKTLLDSQQSYFEEKRKLDLQLVNNSIEKLRIKAPILDVPKSKRTYQSNGCLTTMLVVTIVSILVFVMALAGNLMIGLSKEDVPNMIIAGIIFVIIPVSILYILNKRSRKKRELYTYENYLNELEKSNKARMKEYEIFANHNNALYNELKRQEEKLNTNHPYSIAKALISHQNPNWEVIINSISAKLPIMSTDSFSNPNYDPLISKIAYDIIHGKIKSLMSIKSNYTLSFDRINIIMDQLEQLNIIEKQERYKDIKVIINKEILDKILEYNQIN